MAYLLDTVVVKEQELSRQGKGLPRITNFPNALNGMAPNSSKVQLTYNVMQNLFALD